MLDFSGKPEVTFPGPPGGQADKTRHRRQDCDSSDRSEVRYPHPRANRSGKDEEGDGEVSRGKGD